MKAVKTSLVVLGAIVGLVFAVNALVLFIANPVNIHGQDTSKHYADYKYAEVRVVENLRSGGIGRASFPVFGYVNVTNDKEIVYINQKEIDRLPDFDNTSYAYKHEVSHIYQKLMVAEHAGGFPSYTNPIQSFKYYNKLFELDRTYQELMPDFNYEEESSMIPGIEVAAECFAQHRNITPDYKAPYVERGYCTNAEKRITLGMVTGKWPTELTDKQWEQVEKMPSIWLEGSLPVKKTNAMKPV